ncbi:stealth family protein [Plantibacter sp. Mn2098]|uniref:stealth family protein n=1 Tax=Plantibacter sp. Mn2098 TaxID=3395266 RepID=UPI003BBF87E3
MTIRREHTVGSTTTHCSGRHKRNCSHPEADTITNELDNQRNGATHTPTAFTRSEKDPNPPELVFSTPPELVLVTQGSRTNRFDRPDVVQRKGVYTLINGHLTPQASMTEDLLAVAAAFDAADIEYLLIRGDHDRPVIVVDRSLRKRVKRALSTAFADEPFYAVQVKVPSSGGKPADEPSLLADEPFGGRHKGSVFRLFRPRIEPIGRLRYGQETAPQLEFWHFGEEEIVAPVENVLMRTTLPRGEAIEATVDRYGRSWRTLEHMFDPLASDITFDIDLVFSWVDGSSEEFQRARAKRMQSYVVGEGDDSDARFRQINELKYALRSVHTFAPWIRHIYIATDSPTPEWLAEHPKVTIVPSEAFFADQDALPTHNSMAVESQLHHIEGLSEHFLYSNDDMFIGRPVTPELFFSPGGVSKFVEASTRIGLGANDPTRSGFENAARVNRRLLRERFGRVTTRHLEHCAAPLRRSIMGEMEQEFHDEFARTAASAFRAADNISVTNSLYHYYALMTGRAVQQTQAKVRYIETTLKQSLSQMDRLLKRRDQDMFCLNDGSRPEISVEERTTAVIDFLDRYFPFPAPWEREVGERAQAAGGAGAADAGQSAMR